MDPLDGDLHHQGVLTWHLDVPVQGPQVGDCPLHLSVGRSRDTLPPGPAPHLPLPAPMAVGRAGHSSAGSPACHSSAGSPCWQAGNRGAGDQEQYQGQEAGGNTPHICRCCELVKEQEWKWRLCTGAQDNRAILEVNRGWGDS